MTSHASQVGLLGTPGEQSPGRTGRQEAEQGLSAAQSLSGSKGSVPLWGDPL